MKSILLVFPIAGALLANVAHADDTPASDSFVNYAGLGVQRMPAWQGADNHRNQWVPLLQVTVDKNITLSTSDGLTIDFIHRDGWEGGFYGNYMWGRSSDGLGPRLRGRVDPLSPRLNAGGYLEYHPNEVVNFGANVSHDTDGAGAYLNVYVDSGLPTVFGVEESVQLQWQAMNGAAMRRFFGLTPTQAASLDTRSWRPGAGSQQIELEYDALIPLGKRLAILASVDYSRLLGNAADSPLVQHFGSANQWTTTVGVVYRW